MTPLAIIDRIRECGGELRLLPDGKRLVIEHRSRVPDEVAAEAKACANELRDFLKNQGSAASIASIGKIRWEKLNIGDLIRQAKRYGVDVVLGEDHIRITASQPVPHELLDTLTRKAPQVIRRLYKLETDQELKRRFGSLSRHGRLCRGCLTIELVRDVGGIETCDECLIDLTRKVVIDAITQDMLGGGAA